MQFIRADHLPHWADTLWLVMHNGRHMLAPSEDAAWDTAAESIAEWSAHWLDMGSPKSADWWTENAMSDLTILELENPS